MTVSLTLDALRVRNDRLEVDYVLANADTRDLYVYNLVADQFGQLGPRSETPRNQLAQACLAGPGELAWLLAIPPVPNAGPGVTMFGPLYPRCAKLEAGRAYQAKLIGPLPLAEWNLYDPPLRSGPDVRRERIDSLRLIADYVFADEAYYAEPDFEYAQAFQVRSQHPPHRVEARASLAEFGLELCVQANILRFEP